VALGPPADLNGCRGRDAERGAALAPAAAGPSPERAALDGEQRTIARLARALPPSSDPLVLVGSGDYSYDDVAAMLRRRSAP
jgi:hypothetical protein